MTAYDADFVAPPAIDAVRELDPAPRLLMGPGPVDRLSARAARHVGADPGPVRSAVHRLHEPDDGALPPRLPHRERVDVPDRRLGAGRHRGLPRLADRARRQGAGADFRPLRPSAGRDRRGASAPRSSTIEAEWGTVFEPDAGRGGDQEAPAEGRRHLPGRYLDDHAAAARRDRRRSAAGTTRCSMSTARPRSPATRSRPTPGRSISPRAACRSACRVRRAPRRSRSTSARPTSINAPQAHRGRASRPPGMIEGNGPIIQSNYFDLAMLMDYWSPKRLNHHTEAASMLYAARECARVVLEEGLDAGIARHRLASAALRAGLEAMGLELFGDASHRMANVTGVVIPKAIKDSEQRARRDARTTSASRSAPRSGRWPARSGASAPWATSPQGQRAALPRLAGGGAAPQRLCRAGGRRRRCRLQGLRRRREAARC